MHVRCHRSLDYTMFRAFLDDNPVLTDLLLNQYHLLSSIDHKVTTWIQWTFLKPAHVILGFQREDAPRASQHYGKPPNHNTLSTNLPHAAPVSQVDKNWCRVCRVAQPAFIRSDGGRPLSARHVR